SQARPLSPCARTGEAAMLRVRFVTLLPLLLFAPTLVRAGVPPSGTSTVPPCFSLVGASAAGVPALAGRFTVIVRDIASFPVPGAHVLIDLAACNDLHICPDQGDPAVTVNCTAKEVMKIAAGDGSVSFTILGGSNGGPPFE